jgi:L-amino acid N-acyltransferase YncA
MSWTISPMRPEDYPAVSAIYREGIDTGDATFETAVPGWADWNASHLPQGRLVARRGAELLGWAALGPASPRPAYAGVAEVSVYVGKTHRGAGVGKALLAALVAESERCGIWTLQAGIFPENEASLALHRGAGFREVGRREKLGRTSGRWRDVMLLERRSLEAGVE